MNQREAELLGKIKTLQNIINAQVDTIHELKQRRGNEYLLKELEAARREVEANKDDARLGQFRLGRRKGLQPVNLRRRTLAGPPQRDHALGLHRRPMRVTDFRDG